MTEDLREGHRPSGLTRLWLATLNSRRGFLQCYRSEAAFRQEVWLACLLLPTGLWLGQNAVERALLVGAKATFSGSRPLRGAQRYPAFRSICSAAFVTT